MSLFVIEQRFLLERVGHPQCCGKTPCTERSEPIIYFYVIWAALQRSVLNVIRDTTSTTLVTLVRASLLLLNVERVAKSDVLTNNTCFSAYGRKEIKRRDAVYIANTISVNEHNYFVFVFNINEWTGWPFLVLLLIFVITRPLWYLLSSFTFHSQLSRLCQTFIIQKEAVVYEVLLAIGLHYTGKLNQSRSKGLSASEHEHKNENCKSRQATHVDTYV